jgi:hypothetical protein
VEWFERLHLDPVTGLWVVHPDIIHRWQNWWSVLHLDSFLCGAHLIPVYGTEMLPVNFDYSDSLDAFSAFYVNKYIDHHANEIAFWCVLSVLVITGSTPNILTMNFDHFGRSTRARFCIVATK